MLILRLRQIECALADGRLDEASRLVSADDVRNHRRGQELAGKLARALVQRGREHLAAGRLSEAEGDCHAAMRLAGNIGEAAQLRAAVNVAIQTVEHQRSEKEHAMAAARQQIAAGNLSVGQKMLEDVQQRAPEAFIALRDLEGKRALLDGVARKAEEALAREDWEAAVELIASAGGACVSHEKLRELSVRTMGIINDRIESAFADGRLDEAELLLNRLGRIGGRSVELEKHQRVLDQCRLAWRQIEEGQLREAEQTLRRLETSCPQARWIKPAIADVRQAEEALGRLKGGAIAMTADQVGKTVHAARDDGRPLAPPCAAQPASSNAAPISSHFILQVDGVGAFYVMRRERISIGPISGREKCDLALMAEANTPLAHIARADEDYVLNSTRAVAVNDAPATQKLLADGDRVALSPRCRFVFRRPNPASTTAVLDLSGTRISRADVRRVVLMDRELIIGPGPSAHVRCDDLPQNVVLCVRDGSLICQGRSEVYLDEHAAGRMAPFAVGNHVRVGDVRFVVTEA